MVTQSTNIITLPRSAIREKEGVVILPLRKWREVEEMLEDAEMYCSENLAREISKRRKEKKSVPLEELLKKYNI